MSLKFGKQTIIVLLCNAVTRNDNDVKAIEPFLLLMPKAFPHEALDAVPLHGVSRYLARHDNADAIRLPFVGAD